MSFAPQHDWAAYPALTAQEDAAWLCSLSTSQRFDLYADMFNLAWNARQNNTTADWEALDRWRWEQKLAQRLRYVEVYRNLDEMPQCATHFSKR